MNNVGTALIKFTDSEINLLINSLEMSISTIVPCVDNGAWKVPYENLKRDLIKINKGLIEKKNITPVTIEEQLKERNPSECTNCED